MKQSLIIMLLLLLFITLMGYPVKITSWQMKEDIKRLNELNASIDYVNPETQTIIVYVPDDENYNLLLANGFQTERIADLAKEYADTLWEETKDSDNPMRAYYTWTEFITFMQNTATQYPNICQLVQFGTSVQGRPLYFMKISDNFTQQENEPELRYFSSIHGDEVVGYDLLIRLIQLLTTQYGTTPRISNIVNNTELWICPMLNPDGYIAHERYNANNVDLNRNFALPVGSQHPDGMTWQPETIAVMNHGNEQSINLSANFHGGALVVNYAWDYTYTLAPDNDLLIQAALSYAFNNSDMYNSTEFPQGITNGAQWYVATGTLQDWVYAFNGAMDMTIELGQTKWPPSTQLDSYWNLNQESLLSYIEFVQKGLHGTVTNSAGTPLNATITVNAPGINIKTDSQVGDYHRMLLPGTYLVNAYADDYQSATAEIVIPANTAVTHNFVLMPEQTTDFSGVVLNLSGNPVANAVVKLSRANNSVQAQTNASGEFAFADVAQDEYMVKITASGFGVYSNNFILNEDSNRQIFVLSNPIFFDDFESGLANWTVQSPWAIVTQNTNHVLTDSPSGNYANNLTREVVLSGPVSLSYVSNVTLSFDIKYSLEANYDFLYVYASTNGTSWNLITSFTGVSTEWQNQSFSLNSFANNNLFLKFRLSTDNGITADGVYIDNVMISGLSTVQTVYGDTDANWMINMLDAQNILEYSVGNNPIPQIDTYPWSAFRLEAADVDNDNQISATDAYYIYNRLLSYSSAFPAQNGNNISFSNPMLTHADGQGQCGLYFLSNPQYLKSLSLNFSASEALTIDVLDWQIPVDDVITTSSTDSKSISALILNNAQLTSSLLNMSFTTSAEVITCTGLVNDIPVNFNIGTTPNDDNHTEVIPTALIGNYPNPFNPETTIRFSLEKDNILVRLSIYNTKGQLVRNLVNANLDKGYHNYKFDGTDVSRQKLGNGIYFYRLVTHDKEFIGKMVLLK